VIAAAIVFLWLNDALRPARDVLLAIIVVVIAAGLILAPWWLRLVRGLAAERAERIRSQERAEVAAHLHDSVLQTLALVQQRADDPREVAALARRQERELRAWLNDAPAAERHARRRVGGGRRGGRGLARRRRRRGGGRRRAARRGREAVVAAAREALVNAAKFAGGPVSVYAEAGEERIEVFVATAARASTSTTCRATGAACASRSSAGWSATAAARRSTRRPAAAPRSSW
jgi:hypothetical protein